MEVHTFTTDTKHDIRVGTVRLLAIMQEDLGSKLRHPHEGWTHLHVPVTPALEAEAGAFQVLSDQLF